VINQVDPGAILGNSVSGTASETITTTTTTEEGGNVIFVAGENFGLA
jgi:hypothetical protein